MNRLSASVRPQAAARQQPPTEDAALGKAVLDLLARLSAEPAAVVATILAEEDGFERIWSPLLECLSGERSGRRPLGKALKALLQNGLLFERMLVPAQRMLQALQQPQVASSDTATACAENAIMCLGYALVGWLGPLEGSEREAQTASLERMLAGTDLIAIVNDSCRASAAVLQNLLQPAAVSRSRVSSHSCHRSQRSS
uniref:Uncharacterized protein n=1 Tax=Tetradesmus obliquus TaxID=3088 RepID=A0A383WKL5_TETOB|eukprot:jgi/Sobl393_1/11161/SZX78005.1